MFTAPGQCSLFLRELEADGAVAITDTDGMAVREEGCPSCKQGVLILRSGPYGEFRFCSNFPVCSYKPRKREKERSISTKQTQLDKFKQAARDLEGDDDEEQFDERLGRIARQKPKPEPKGKDSDD